MADELTKQLYRRKLIKGMGGLAAIGTVGQIVGCGGEGAASSTSSALSSSSSSLAASSSSSVAVSSSSVASSSSSSVAQVAAEWLTGGTASMTAPFPPASPFSDADSVCLLQEPVELGPCYFDRVDNGDDISDGQPGLPNVLAIRVVDASCNPMSGVDVEIWHTNNDGVYSLDETGSTQNSGSASVAGEDGGAFNSGDICTSTEDQEANQESYAGRWFRGTLTTDENGIAYFLTCVPASYAPSAFFPDGLRCCHIHARFSYQGNQQLTTQFCFDETLLDEIYSTHPEYPDRSGRIRAENDGSFSRAGANYLDHTFTSVKQEDGSMLSYITVGIDMV